MMTNRFIYAAAEEAAAARVQVTVGGKRSAAGNSAVARFDLFAALAEVIANCGRWLRYRRTVNELTRLDDRMLQDIGLRRDEIHHRSRKLADRFMEAMPRP